MKIKLNDVLFVLGLICALWFAAFSWFWLFLLNIVFVFPFGLLSLVFWFLIRREKRKRNKLIPILFILGLASAAISFALFL